MLLTRLSLSLAALVAAYLMVAQLPDNSAYGSLALAEPFLWGLALLTLTATLVAIAARRFLLSS